MDDMHDSPVPAGDGRQAARGVRRSADRFRDLPYGPVLSRALGTLYELAPALNRYFTLPMLNLGLGPLMGTPLTGSLMVLRTTGRKSGLQRETPLGYSIRDGCVYVCAGFGASTGWYRNILADPHVEAVLPTVAVTGIAETVTDPAELVPAFRHLILCMGVLGRRTVGDVRVLPDERVRELGEKFPIVRIRPTGLAPGPADPGGLLWVTVTAVSALGALALARRCWSRPAARADCRCRAKRRIPDTD